VQVSGEVTHKVLNHTPFTDFYFWMSFTLTITSSDIQELEKSFDYYVHSRKGSLATSKQVKTLVLLDMKKHKDMLIRSR
jgi:hypothetical protein